MNNFTNDLLKNVAITAAVSLVATPLTIIGMGIGGTLWGVKVEPWLNKRKNKKSATNEEL